MTQLSEPLPRRLGSVIRLLVKTWARFPKAPGYLYQVIERWGERLAVEPLECQLFNGVTMRCDLRDQIQRQIYFFGAYEPIEAYLFKLLLKPGMIVVDGGANVGQYTLIAATEVGCTGEVHAFEAVPANFGRLQAHVLGNAVNATVRINMKALWHQTEDLNLHLERGMLGNKGAYTIGVPPTVVDTVTSKGVRLDDYVNEHGLERVDLIKLDIEGAEWFALRGAVETIRRWRPTLLLEINRGACMQIGYEPERIWQFLKPFGYLMRIVGQSAEASTPISSLSGIERANMLFYVGEIPDEVTRGWTLKSVLRFHVHSRARRPS